MSPIFKTLMSTYQPEANFNEEFRLVKSLIFKTPKISQMSIKDLYVNPEFHVPF